MAQEQLSLDAASQKVIDQCMAVTKHESVVVLTDEECQVVGEALYTAAEPVTSDAAIVRYPPRYEYGEDPPEPAAVAIKNADVALAATANSLSQADARIAATDAGTRVATLPEITSTDFRRGMVADYETVERVCMDVLNQVEDADTLRVTAPSETDIKFELGDREWQLDTGIVHEPGALSNLPAGEVYISPETAEGTFVVDGTIMPHGRVPEEDSITCHVEDGQVIEIDDPEVRALVADAADDAGADAWNLGECGIGTNVAIAGDVDSMLLGEKAAGTVHLAIGRDAGIGGDTMAPIHLDGSIMDPTVYADGEPIDLPTPTGV